MKKLGQSRKGVLYLTGANGAGPRGDWVHQEKGNWKNTQIEEGEANFISEWGKTCSPEDIAS